MKKKANNLSISLEVIQYETNIEEKAFLGELESLNKNKNYIGIIVQMPLPKHIDAEGVVERISWQKDLDGITPYNIGLLFRNNPFIIPATAQAVDITLDYISNNYSIVLKGKNTAIIGRSLTVGKPLISLLLKKNITPTILHTKTINSKEITKNMEIVVAACGVPELINDEWIKKGAIVIDVGIHSIDTPENEKGYKLCGDVKADSVTKKASILTAVPGGIGTVTSTLVFANALKSFFIINKNERFKFSFEK